jgi:hypothetical protein
LFVADGRLIADRTEAHEWETFTIKDNNTLYSTMPSFYQSSPVLNPTYPGLSSYSPYSAPPMYQTQSQLSNLNTWNSGSFGGSPYTPYGQQQWSPTLNAFQGSPYPQQSLPQPNYQDQYKTNSYGSVQDVRQMNPYAPMGPTSFNQQQQPNVPVYDQQNVNRQVQVPQQQPSQLPLNQQVQQVPMAPVYDQQNVNQQMSSQLSQPFMRQQPILAPMSPQISMNQQVPIQGLPSSVSSNQQQPIMNQISQPMMQPNQIPQVPSQLLSNPNISTSASMIEKATPQQPIDQEKNKIEDEEQLRKQLEAIKLQQVTVQTTQQEIIPTAPVYDQNTPQAPYMPPMQQYTPKENSQVNAPQKSNKQEQQYYDLTFPMRTMQDQLKEKQNQ